MKSPHNTKREALRDHINAPIEKMENEDEMHKVIWLGL